MDQGTHTQIGNKDAFRIEPLRLLAVMCGAGWDPGKCDFVSAGGVGGLFQSTWCYDRFLNNETTERLGSGESILLLTDAAHPATTQLVGRVFNLNEQQFLYY